MPGEGAGGAAAGVAVDLGEAMKGALLVLGFFLFVVLLAWWSGRED